MSSPKRARTAHDKDTDYVTYYIPCASSIMKGKRTTFEDRAMLCPAFDWNTNFHGRHLFGVFDGHGGYHVAEYCKNSFTRTLKNRTEYKEGKIAEALTATFLQMDEPLWYAEDRKVLLPDERDLKKFHVIFDPTSGSFEFELEPEKKTPPKDKVKDALEDLKHGPGISSGTTAVVAYFDKPKKRLIVANAGDAACFLSRNGRSIEMSTAHKPNNEEEKARIEKAGGKVVTDDSTGISRISHGLDLGLNVSRSIGDLDYKKNLDLPPTEQAVTAVPSIKEETITPEDRFIVLVSDGVTDAMTGQEIVDFINKRLDDDDDLPSITEAVLNRCYRNSGDNMTCVIVFLEEKKKSKMEDEKDDE